MFLPQTLFYRDALKGLDKVIVVCYPLYMKPNQSLIQQKARGTYDRNLKIIQLYQSGIIVNMAEIGRLYDISRQAVRSIIKRSDGITGTFREQQ
ncbi:MAG: helix-turn-helix domain-containing protein [Dehalococcoidales bacterium]|nr:helix-turn-helix domain-containing protein [Dehalococcoidales bacterium]